MEQTTSAKTPFTPEHTLLVIVDPQEKFRKVISAMDRIINNTSKLIRAAQLLDIPILVTRQHPEKLGDIVTELQDLATTPIDKQSFDCFEDASFSKKVTALQRSHLMICGIESHICIFQTAIHAKSKGFTTHLIADAISSRKQIDHDIALQRMSMEGVHIASAEMVLFQLMKDAQHPMFRQICSRVTE